MPLLDRLGFAEGQSDLLHACLYKAQCSSAIKELQEASSKGAATLKSNKCTEQALREEVLAVNRALEEAFRQCIQKGVGKQVFEDMCEGDGPESYECMAYMYYHEDPSLFRNTVGRSMRAIHHMATRALRDLEYPASVETAHSMESARLFMKLC